MFNPNSKITVVETLLINAGGTYYREATLADFQKAASDKNFPILEINIQALEFLKNADIKAVAEKISVSRVDSDNNQIFYSLPRPQEPLYTMKVERATGQDRPKGVPTSGTIFITPLFPPATRG